MSNELVPVAMDDTVPALIPANPFEGNSQVRIYFDCDTADKLGQIGRAIQIDTPNFPDSGLRTVEVVGLTLFTRPVTPAGEVPVRYGVYLALHCDGGDNYVTASGNALGLAAGLAAAYGPPPWPKGVTVTIGRAPQRPGKIARIICAPGNCVAFRSE
jgi:hypothetical protein